MSFWKRLKKYWINLAIAFIWLLLGIANTLCAIDNPSWVTWVIAILDYVVAACDIAAICVFMICEKDS